MPLPTGVWKLNVNGNLGTLSINAVDPHGNLTSPSNIFFPGGGVPVQGFWDEGSQRLTFTAVEAEARFGDAYTGFLFQDTFRMPGITGSVVFTLSGYVESFTKGTTDRAVFGWYAQIGSS
jgi:hypothetical protein